MKAPTWSVASPRTKGKVRELMSGGHQLLEDPGGKLVCGEEGAAGNSQVGEQGLQSTPDE